MNCADNVTQSHSLRPNTLRVRRHRQRRREGLRLLTVEIPEPVIEAAIARGLLKPEDCAQSSSVIRSAFAAQLSDTALNWLTSNAVITSEQRADAVAILQRISEWLEGAAHQRFAGLCDIFSSWSRSRQASFVSSGGVTNARD
jgi:hypothetical protein